MFYSQRLQYFFERCACTCAWNGKLNSEQSISALSFWTALCTNDVRNVSQETAREPLGNRSGTIEVNNFDKSIRRILRGALLTSSIRTVQPEKKIAEQCQDATEHRRTETHLHCTRWVQEVRLQQNIERRDKDERREWWTRTGNQWNKWLETSSKEKMSRTHNQEGDQAFYSGEGSSFNVAIMKVLMQLE